MKKYLIVSIFLGLTLSVLSQETDKQKDEKIVKLQMANNAIRAQVNNLNKEIKTKFEFQSQKIDSLNKSILAKTQQNYDSLMGKINNLELKNSEVKQTAEKNLTFFIISILLIVLVGGSIFYYFNGSIKSNVNSLHNKIDSLNDSLIRKNSDLEKYTNDQIIVNQKLIETKTNELNINLVSLISDNKAMMESLITKKYKLLEDNLNDTSKSLMKKDLELKENIEKQMNDQKESYDNQIIQINKLINDKASYLNEEINKEAFEIKENREKISQVNQSIDNHVFTLKKEFTKQFDDFNKNLSEVMDAEKILEQQIKIASDKIENNKPAV